MDGINVDHLIINADDLDRQFDKLHGFVGGLLELFLYDFEAGTDGQRSSKEFVRRGLSGLENLANSHRA